MGEVLKLEVFIRKYYTTLCASALHYVNSPDIAQDIAQEVIIKFWENRKEHQNLNSIENFLFIMIRNESLNYLRSCQREAKRYDKIINEESEDPHILNMLIEEETNQILLHAINQLPRQMARIMRLVLSGYENKEIAELLGASVNIIKTLKYAALRKLREYFEKHQYNIR